MVKLSGDEKDNRFITACVMICTVQLLYLRRHDAYTVFK